MSSHAAVLPVGEAYYPPTRLLKLVEHMASPRWLSSSDDVDFMETGRGVHRSLNLYCEGSRSHPSDTCHGRKASRQLQTHVGVVPLTRRLYFTS